MSDVYRSKYNTGDAIDASLDKANSALQPGDVQDALATISNARDRAESYVNEANGAKSSAAASASAASQSAAAANASHSAINSGIASLSESEAAAVAHNASLTAHEGMISTFDRICKIAGLAPTLYLNFKEQDYRHYSSTKGLEKKALADILTFTRGSDGGITNARSQYEALSTDEPRLDFDPETGLCRGLLVEESRTNLLTYSAYQDASGSTPATGWVIGHNTGTTTHSDSEQYSGGKVATHTGTSQRAYYSRIVPVLAGVVYTLSAYFHEISNGGALLHVSGPEESLSGILALALSDLAFDGPGRYSITFTPLIDTSVGVRVGLGCTTNATGTVSHEMAQLEEGELPTSYIPTTTAALERAADVASITGTTFSDFYRQDEGSLLADARWTGGGLIGSNQRFALYLGDGSTNENIIIYNSAGRIGAVYSKSNSIEQALLRSDATLDGINATSAVGFATNDYSLYSNGVFIDETSSGQVGTFDRLFIGCGFSGQQLGGEVGYIVYFPRKLPNATLQQLSALGA